MLHLSRVLAAIAPLACLPLVVSAQEPAPEPLGAVEMAYPFPSPSGDRVVFQSNMDGRWQLYIADAATGGTTRLTTSPADDTHPAFSPDGRQVAFISNEPGNDDVYILDVETGARRALSPHPGKDGHPKWSTDGEWLTFNRTFDPEDREGDVDSAILRVRDDGTGLETISNSEYLETFPSFSPDGRRVAFIEWHPNAAGEPQQNAEIITVEIETGTRTRLTDNDVFDAYPYWGRSGDWIYFTPIRRMADGRGNGEVHRISPDGIHIERLTPEDDRADLRGIPSADETRLVYNNGKDGRVWIMTTPIGAAADAP